MLFLSFYLYLYRGVSQNTKFSLCFSSRIDYTSTTDQNLRDWTQMNIVAVQPKQKIAYSKIDFADFEPSNDPLDEVIINLHLGSMIFHTFPEIDRCCKLNGTKIKYDGIDNMSRISCDIPINEFIETFVEKREPVTMVGCQDQWKAKYWTFDNLMDRYDNLTKWHTTWTFSDQDKLFHQNELNSDDIRYLISQV